MDPLSITAAIVGIGSVAAKVIDALLDFKSRYRDAAATIDGMRKEIETHAATFKHLQRRLSEEAVARKLRKDQALEIDIRQALGGCETVLKGLQEKAEKSAPPQWWRIRTAWSDEVLKDLLAQLSRHASGLVNLVQTAFRSKFITQSRCQICRKVKEKFREWYHGILRKMRTGKLAYKKDTLSALGQAPLAGSGITAAGIYAYNLRG